MRYCWWIVLVLFSCQRKDEDNVVVSDKPYFDLQQLLKYDIEANTQQKLAETKTVVVNGRAETHETDTVNWAKEFQILLDCDINKPNWKGKYQVLELKNQHKTIYTALTSKIPVHSLTIQYDSNGVEVTSVEIEKEIGTFLFKNRQRITYIPAKSFKIVATQSAVFMKDFNSEVEVKFVNKPI